jgi:dTDP-4-dehydrorhamnose reductase
MKRALVLGGSGFVGRELADFFQCPATSLTAREGLVAVDATRIDDLRHKIVPLAPDILVNCVGLADVDRAEREPSVADSLNRLVVENLAHLQPDLGFRLVHISTDYVFDGSKGGYRETDEVHPINEYGRSKLRGEAAALRSPGSLIIRISSPYGRGFGARKPQFFRYAMDSLRAGRAVKALTDQRVTATFLPDLARAIEVLIARSLTGVVHVGSEEPLTRFEFAQKVAQVVGADPSLVTPGIRSEMKQWTAPRPNDTTLNVDQSRSNGVIYTPVESALRELLSN